MSAAARKLEARNALLKHATDAAHEYMVRGYSPEFTRLIDHLVGADEHYRALAHLLLQERRAAAMELMRAVTSERRVAALMAADQNRQAAKAEGI